MENLGILLIALIVGMLIGALIVWLSYRRSATPGIPDSAALERLRTAEASARADAERARGQIGQAEVRVQEAQAEVERIRRTVAEAQTSTAEARADAADQQARVAALTAQVTAATAERDTALARADELAADRDSLAKEFKVLAGQALDEHGKKAEASAEQRLQATEQLMGPVRESLERFNARLVEVEKERVAMTTELRDHVKTVRLTGDELRRETASLSKALRKPQVRGAWGELQLQRVAEIAGMVEHCDFRLQQTSQTSEERTIRPDMTVTLAENKVVFVDSKVPLTSFLDAQETADDAEHAALLAQFAKNVRTHIDQLSGKNYFKAEATTPEFVVLFLPSEALAAEALTQLPDLHEYAAHRGIVLATPTTLIAMLRAVAYSWKQAALAESASEVFQLGRELYDRLGTMGGHVDRVGRALASTVKAYNETVGSLEGRVLVQARRFRDLQVSDKDLAPLTPVHEQARPITTPELIDSATQAPAILGRTPASPGLPEAPDLQRGEPDLFDLTQENAVTHRTDRGTMAG
ncbi:MAG: DNA recombination protein RmuC [Propioniciclava sp.]